jgi:tetratricopeptide (TPR) repeat protein
MASRFREPSRRGLMLVAALATALCSGACSFDLGSLSAGSGKESPPAAGIVDAPATDPRGSQVHTARAQTLLQTGKIADALAELNIALDLDPHNAKALQQRGLLYQNERQHELAIADFTSANGLTPQQPDPLLGRATSYLALGKAREAAADLDEAVQASPQNGQLWIQPRRGL